MVTASETKHLKLEVSNLGPIAEASVELRPMSVFVGPSNTGKSYLATLIYALHQSFGAYSAYALNRRATYRTFFRRPPMMIPVTDMDLSAADVANAYSWTQTERFKIQAAGQTNAPPFESDIPVEISGLVRRALDEFASLNTAFDAEIVRCFGIEKTDSLVHYTGNSSMEHSMHSAVSKEWDDGEIYRYEIGVTQRGTNIKAALPDVTPIRLIHNVQLPWFFLSPDDINDQREGNVRLLLGALAGGVVSNSVGPLGQAAHYLPADRAGVMHAHQVAVRGLIANASRMVLRPDSPMPVLSGVLGDFLEQLVALASGPISMDSQSNDDLARHLERTLVGGAVRVVRSQIDYPSFVYRPEGWQRDLPLMNASSMVSELAPVVLYLRYVVQPGDTLIIEEPESHLHPQAQVDFTRVLAAAVKAGIRIIITTHSEWVLEELANLVRLSELPPERRNGIEAADSALASDELGAWFFDPNGENGGSVVREIPLDVDSGTFPSGFGLITENLYNRWVQISNRVERNK